MYRFNRMTRDVVVNCKKCKKDITFKLPEDILDGQTDFPITFRYIHGEPIHSIAIFLDKQERIRGVEVGDALTISPDIIDTFTNSLVSTNSEASVLVRTITSAFTTIINLYADEPSTALRAVGEVLGETYEKLFKRSDNEVELIKEIGQFWRRNNLGNIVSIDLGTDALEFSVEDCFECSHLINVGRNSCHFNEGFFKAILEIKYPNKYVDVTEVECRTSGFDACKFSAKISSGSAGSF